MKGYEAILQPESTYHIYNRANGNELLFVQDDNYDYFIRKYHQYISPMADIFCYCLMPNHFHFLVRMKSESELGSYFATAYPKFQTLDKLLSPSYSPISKLVSKRFANMFSSYTQAFNKQQCRKGSLFIKNFKRKKVIDEKHLHKLVHYIHYNPVEAGLCDKPEEWRYSSWNALVSDRPTNLKREEVIGWFDDLENLVYCHRYPPQLTGLE